MGPLLRTIHNLFVDHVRRRNCLRFLPLEDIEESQKGTLVMEGLEAPLARAEIGSAMTRLKAQEREILAFHYVYGWTAAEIGAITGRSRGTVLSLLQRSKQKLRSILMAAEHSNLYS